MNVKPTQRNTRQRQTIYEELSKLTSHPTARELHDIVRKHMPRISLGTVYRNLDLLVKSGRILKLHVDGLEARYDGNPDKHAHIRCVGCGRVADVHALPEEVKRAGIELKTLAGFRVLDRRLDFTGVCPDCEQRRETRDL